MSDNMLDILLIGVGLSMDAFAVSVTNGLTIPGYKLRHAALTAACFGFFQGLMPLLGWLLGSTVSHVISAWGPYVSFFLLAFIGVKMIVEAVKGGEEKCETGLRFGRLIVMAVATSLDALAVGVSFAFMDVPLAASVLLIAAVTFVICLAGGLLGSRVPGISCKAAGIIGGAVLCCIGAKLLLEGIGML